MSRRLRFALALLAAALLPGAECFNLDELIDEDALGIPDPCETPEIACNGIDENCDGVDDCAEVPVEAVEALRWALGFAELDCAGIDGLRAELVGLDDVLDRDQQCPAILRVEGEGPVWDGVEDCGEAAKGADSCARSGASSRETLTGGCATESGRALTGSRLSGEGSLRIELVRAGELQLTEVEGTELDATDWSLERDAAPDSVAYSGTGGRTRRTVSSFVAADEDPAGLTSLSVVDGCSLDLAVALSGPVLPIDVETRAVALGGQQTLTRDNLESPALYEVTTNGNISGRVAGVAVTAQFVRALAGDPEQCDQEGEVVVEGTGDSGAVLWRLRLDLDDSCELCGDLRLGDDRAGLWCAGDRRTP